LAGGGIPRCPDAVEVAAVSRVARAPDASLLIDDAIKK
jgi:hypothetical protein